MPASSNRRSRIPLIFVAAVVIFAGLQSFAGAWPISVAPHHDAGSGPTSRISSRHGAVIVGIGPLPRFRDRDRDGLSNRVEVIRTRTNPRKADTDGDGLSDKIEIVKTHTNPRKADTDGDGYNDGQEVAAGSDPRNPLSVPPQPPAPPAPVAPPPPPPPDTTAPDTQVTSGPGSTTQATTASFVFASTEQGSTFECRLDAGNWSSCASPKGYSGLTVGSHVFSVKAKDGSGNVDATPAQYSWTVQAPPPPSETPEATAIWTKPANAMADQPVTLDGSASTGTSPLTCTWNFENKNGSVVYDTRSGCKITFTFESTGTKYVALDVHGSDGASDENKQSFMVSAGADTTPPDTSISSSPPSTTTSTIASFSFSSTEQGSTFECQLDGSTWTECTSPKAYSNLSLGTHSFQVRATDGSGNTDQTPATFSWTVSNQPDTTPPDTTISSPPPSTTTSTSASFSFSSSESGSTFACQLDGGAFGSCSSPKSYSNLAVGSHSFAVRATDQAGNADPTPASWTWTIEAAPPPPPSGCASGATSATTAAQVRSAVQADDDVCVVADVGNLNLTDLGSSPVVISDDGGSMGAIDLENTTDLTIQDARFRSIEMRGADRTKLLDNQIGGTGPNDRESDQLIFMPDESNDVSIEGNDIGWTVADDSGNTGYGCRCYGATNNLRFVGNWVHDIAADGFQGTNGANVLIDRNEIGPVGAPPGSSSHSDNIQIVSNGPNLRITNNWIHHQGYYEGKAVANSGSTYIHGGTTNSIVYENNLIDTAQGRTEICGLGTGGTSRSNITVRNNTWVNGGLAFTGFPSFEWDCDSGSGNTVARNIAIDPDGGFAQDGSASAATFSANLWGQPSLVTLDASGNCTSSNCNPAGQEPIGYRKPSGVSW